MGHHLQGFLPCLPYALGHVGFPSLSSYPPSSSKSFPSTAAENPAWIAVLNKEVGIVNGGSFLLLRPNPRSINTFCLIRLVGHGWP